MVNLAAITGDTLMNREGFSHIHRQSASTHTNTHGDTRMERIMVILLQSAGGQEIKVSVGRVMCQDVFISSEIEDSCLCHQRPF